MHHVRETVDLCGVVQGVGFRPTIKRLADAAGLAGFVQNRAGSVRLCLEGPAAAVESFIAGLPGRLPARARLDAVTHISREACRPGDGFAIRASAAGDRPRVTIPADLAMCPACAAEVFDPSSRFFGYPFTTCTDCGPRYTVVEGTPYDRARTTLSVFPLCRDCARAYADPNDRRFHAESIACPACGPRLALIAPDGTPVPGDPLRGARAALAAGAIVAVRGLGGFHLALNAFDRDALHRLRERKRRPDKPFAVMAADLATVRRYCTVDDTAAATLTDPAGPIVVLDVHPQIHHQPGSRVQIRGHLLRHRRAVGPQRTGSTPPADCACFLASAARLHTLGARAGGGFGYPDHADALPLDLLSPDAATLGVMLPTTPLHALLATPLPGDETPPFPLLVMTSGNRRAEPVAIENGEALERLAGIADVFLVHDREIRLRNDDSLVAATARGVQVWRRARGYAPESLRVSRPLERTVLALGAELKNTVALGFDDEVVLSPHIGDLSTPEALDGLEDVVARFPAFFARTPEVVATDLHPDMHATRTGQRIAAALGLPLVAVQHHHAHALAAMAEHGLDEAIALVFDGTGLGADGTIWGAEALRVDRHGFTRLATFAPVPLPGGDEAVLRPARQVVARFFAAGVDVPAARLARLGVSADEATLWRLQCARGLNAPRTHAAGRVFDAFAAAIGVAPARISWEGQAPTRLEALARRAAPTLAAPVTDSNAAFVTRDDGALLVVDFAPTFRGLAQEDVAPADRERLAAQFHSAMADAVLTMARRARDVGGDAPVVLSGGVFMNRVLTALAAARLEAAGFRVGLHRRVPPNDGGVALGQVLAAGGR